MINNTFKKSNKKFMTHYLVLGYENLLSNLYPTTKTYGIFRSLEQALNMISKYTHKNDIEICLTDRVLHSGCITGNCYTLWVEMFDNRMPNMFRVPLQVKEYSKNSDQP